MRNHILGFKDEEGKGPSVLLFGTDYGVSENIKEMVRIAAGEYPDGIVRVELHNDDHGLERVAINTRPKSPTKKIPTMKIKSLLATLLALFCLIVPWTANAQSEPVYSPNTLWTWAAYVGVTNNTAVAPASYGTLTDGGVITATKQDKLAIQVNFHSNTNGIAGTNTLVFYRSVDGTYYATNVPVVLPIVWTPAANGAKYVHVTNLTMNGSGYLKFGYWTNDNIGAGGVIQVTNIQVKWADKIGAP